MDSEQPGSVHDRTDVCADPVRTDDGRADWSWPPYAPLEDAGERFDTRDWAPASVVRHPLLRVGRWTVLYRRGC